MSRNKFERELHAAAADVMESHPETFGDFADRILATYPLEVVDALGAGEEGIMAGLAKIYDTMK